MTKHDGLDFLDRGGEMGDSMRRFPWSTTALGAPDYWPQSLKTIVRVMLDSRFAMWLSWGADGIFFCNDAYLPTLGLKGQWALGARSDKVWEEIWHDIGPRIEHVLTVGEATWDEGLQLFLRRSGYDEETYHTFSYSPVYNDRNRVAGMLCVVAEDTQRVIGERRLGVLRDLATAPAREAASVPYAGAIVLDALKAHRLDVPFAALYLRGQAQDFQLVGTIPALSSSGQNNEEFVQALLEAAKAAVGRGESDLTLDPAMRIGGPWHEPLRQAVVFNLNNEGDARTGAILVLGVSTRRQLDASYRSFLSLVADQFASQLADAQTRVDAQRRTEALAEIDRAKNLFFSNASHELRTPLTLLLGPIENLLARDDLSTEAATELMLARRNGNRLRKLVNSLLDFSRIEAGRVDAQFQRTDLCAYTADLASSFRSAIEHAGLLFNVRCDADAVMAHVDHDLWEKVVLNLLSNALKFTFEGHIDVEVASTDGQAQLVVRDSGVGIDEAELPKIFERFHRVAGTPSRSQEGTGIGLALTKELVGLHGGSISVTSVQGRGTEFKVTIPLGTAHLPRTSPQARTASRNHVKTSVDRLSFVEDALRSSDATGSPPAPLSDVASSQAVERNREHILVVDDNADMRLYVQRLLQHRWRVSTARDGREALSRIADAVPHLVLTDMMMPNLDGADLIEIIRANESTRHLPVIVLSAQAGEEARVTGLQQGADDYLVKPFDASELLARIEVQLVRARARGVEDRLNKQLADVFRNAPVGVALLRGPDHVYEFANAVYTDMARGRCLLGLPIREAQPELNGQGIIELLDDVYRSRAPYIGHAHPVRVLNPNSGQLEQRCFEFVYQPLLDDDPPGVSGIAVVAVDVTEVMMARTAAEAASRTKDEFIAMLGHELRNPLAPIVTALQLMKIRSPDVAVNERAIIDRQVRHMIRLVDDLLDVSRIARGNLELRKEVIELSVVVDKALETAGPLFEKMRQVVSVKVPRSGMPVSADPVRMSQVVSNLLTNAAKFGGKGGTIDINAVAVEEEQIALQVTDHGLGMAQEELDSVFEMFVQGRQGMDRPQGGLGLGLAIARNLAEMHGGSLQASSKGLGRGSTFTLRLPLHCAPDAVSGQAPQLGVGIDGPKRRILLVDDLEDVALPMRDLLLELGHEVLVAHDGPSALKIAEANGPIDVALLDIGLPVMNGYELAGHLKRLQQSHPLRLVAISGFGQTSDKEMSARHDFDQHLVKPVEFDALIRAIEGDSSAA